MTHDMLPACPVNECGPAEAHPLLYFGGRTSNELYVDPDRHSSWRLAISTLRELLIPPGFVCECVQVRGDW